MSRAADLDRLRDLLDRAARRRGGPWRLGDPDRPPGLPQAGVYVLLDPSDAGPDGSPRVVRVGTHALTETSRATLWGRLRAHRGYVQGPRAGGGNHRGSIFRLHVGRALLRRDGLAHATWGLGSSAPRDVRERERDLERAVSRSLAPLRHVIVPSDDRLQRARVERNAIALLSCLNGSGAEPSEAWLGRWSPHPEIVASGLWNVNHVRAPPEPDWLDELETLVA